jgi:hypothetical protein
VNAVCVVALSVLKETDREGDSITFAAFLRDLKRDADRLPPLPPS